MSHPSASFAPRRVSRPPTTPIPAIKFNDGLFEAFNSAGRLGDAGLRQSVSGPRERFATRAAITPSRPAPKFASIATPLTSARSPNGEYDFGGGPAYATEAIPSESGTHDIQPGRSAARHAFRVSCRQSVRVHRGDCRRRAFSGGEHIGPAAISRNNVSAYAQDTWKITPRLTLDYGLRWDLYTPITERAHRTSSFRTINGKQEYVINPQPGYQTNWHAFEPRVQVSWQATNKITAHAGGGIMAIPPNIWQDNFLTGSTPFSIYPRVVAVAGAPIHYGFQITPDQLPRVYTPSGEDVFATWKANADSFEHHHGCRPL